MGVVVNNYFRCEVLILSNLKVKVTKSNQLNINL